MTEATINSQVGVQLSPEGMAAGAKVIERSIEGIITKLNSATIAAQKAISEGVVAQAKAAALFNGQLKSLGMTMGQVKTLTAALSSGSVGGNLKAAGILGDFGNIQNLGKQARALAEFRSGLDATGSSMNVLRGRVRDLNVEQGRLLQKGVVPNNSDLLKADRINDTAKAYNKLTNTVGDLRGRIAMMGEESKKAFQPMLRNLEQIDKQNAGKFKNKGLTNFEGETASYAKAVGALKEQVVLRERLEAKTRLNIDALKAEGDALFKNTQLQREANLAAQVRAGNTRLNNLGLTGGSIYQRDTNLDSRQDRLAKAAARTRVEWERLTAVQNAPNPAAAQRIDTLIKRYQELQRQIGETIALQNRQENAPAAKTGGFLGGLKSSVGKLTGGGEGEGGGMFGAGALIGRVGAYALAAGGIYAVMSAMKEAVTFTVQFEDSLAQLQAISGSTGIEMQSLSANILEVAKNSANSVLEITKSATMIAQAGYAGRDLTTVLQESVKLSAASGASPDEAVDILTSSLGAFQLAAGESTNITNTLVATLNESKLAVGQVQLGLQYMGATAAQNNITFGELTAAIGAMADAGIRSGSTASTGLRQMITDFIDPSKNLVAELTKVGLTTADVDVKTLGLVEVLTRLRDSGFQAFGAIEVRGANAYNVLSQNIENIQRLEEAGTRQGVADVAAAARLDSLSAKWNMLKSNLSETAAAIGSLLLPPLKVLVDVLSGLVGVFNAIVIPIGKFLITLVQMKAALDGLDFSTFAQLANSVSSETDNMSGSINLASFSLEELQTKTKEAAAAMESAKETEGSLATETEKLILRAQDLAGTNGDLTQTTAAVSGQIDVLAARFPGLREEFSKTEGGVMGLISAFVALDNKAMDTIARLARVTRDQARAEGAKANLEGAQAFSGFESKINRSSFFPRSGSEKAILKDGKRFAALIKQKEFKRAFSEYDGMSSTSRAALAPMYSEMVRYNQSAMIAKETGDAAQLTMDTSKYATSKEGQGVRVMGMRNRAAGTRAGSQGSFMGRNRGQVVADAQSDRANLQSLYDKYTGEGNTAAASIVGAALNQTTQGISAATPDPVKAKKGKKGKSGAAAAKKAANDFARVESSIAKETLEYKKEVYENAVKAIAEAPRLEDLPELLNDIDKSLTDYLEADKAKTLKDILKNNPNQEQRTRLLTEAGKKAEELRIASIDKVGDALGAAITKMVDKTAKNIEDQFDEAMRFVERNVRLSQARVNGLDNPLEQANIPGYFKTVKQREADVAVDRRNRAEIPARDREIAANQALIKEAEDRKSEIQRRLARVGKPNLDAPVGDATTIAVTADRTANLIAMDQVDERLKTLRKSTLDLVEGNDALKASYDVLNEVPNTFGEGFSNALEAVKIQVGAASNIGQELINNLDKPLLAIHEGFKGFFSDILSGTASIGSAFQRMAATIIDSILQMVAVALANQFFKIIGSVLGNAFGGLAPGAGAFSGNAGSGFKLDGSKLGLWNGGEVPGMFAGKQIKGYLGGGMIQTGVATRDSTLINAAKGEYMIRRPAAQSLGKGFLDAINARGAKALSGIPPVVMPTGGGPPVNTNVYVIAPEEKPSLGPSDVIAIISNDVLKGGATKKLIKQVSNG